LGFSYFELAGELQSEKAARIETLDGSPECASFALRGETGQRD
jgi:hypothetical protein